MKSHKKSPGELALGVLSLTIWVGACVIVSQYLVGLPMVGILGLETMSKPVPTAIFSALSYIVALIIIVGVPAIINRKTKDCDRKLLGLQGLPTWTDIGLAPVGYIVYILIAGVLMWLFSLLPWFDATEAQEVGFSYLVSGFDRVVAFITLVVVAPIAEEVIFRGWLYGKLRETIAAQYSNTISMIISTLLVSVTFGVVHLQWNVGVNVFALSIVLCGLREITGTIYSGILLHMLKNGVAFWMLFMM